MPNWAWSYLTPGRRCEHGAVAGACVPCAVTAERARVRALAEFYFAKEFWRHDGAMYRFLRAVEEGG